MKNNKVSDVQVTKAIELLVMGLDTDGDHHKQWCMDQAVRALLGEGYYEYLGRHCENGYAGWETGIAP